MAGRPKKIENYEMISRRCSAGWRLKCFREQHWTQERLAERLNISVATIRRYETGKQLIPLDIAKSLSTISDKPVEYWQGYSQDEIDYLRDVDSSWNAEDSNRVTHESMLRAAAVRYNTFLAVFDVNHPYRYQNIEDTAEYDFDGVPDPDGHNVKKYNGPHLITSAADSSIRVSVAEVPTTPAGWYGLITSIEQKHSA